MAKWSGIIGYVEIKEVERGVSSKSTIVEHLHFGDTFSDHTKTQSSSVSTNDNITLSNKVSIVANDFAIENFGSMKYAVIRGKKWRITDVEFQYPRLILTIGGLYNGK